MRVAIVTESFLPQVNGVANSVLRVLEHLRRLGHEALVLAPATQGKAPREYAGFPVEPLTCLPFPGYREVQVTTSTSFTVEAKLAAFKPDVVHLASPILIGYKGLIAAKRLNLPTVAVYQTDVPSYAGRYGMPLAEPLLWWRIRQMHRLATVTLAPSSAARRQLLDHGVPAVGLWGRGVDTVRFDPAHRDEAWRAAIAPGRKLIGYVGRLAAEKQVADLRVLSDIPATTTVVIGDGPARPDLETLLPRATFMGQRVGHDLARMLASFDVFVHPGELETFGQSLQESLASGVPVIAPARGGPLDIVRPSHTGWLYPPGDLRALRASVLDLIGDESKRRAFGRAARATTRDLTWDRVCDQLLSHYERAIFTHSVGDRV